MTAPFVSPSASVSHLAFVTWDNERPSGGNTYNRELLCALREGGMDVELHRLPGNWPAPAETDLGHAAQLLSHAPISLVDGIVASAAPEAIERAVVAGRDLVILAHMAAADDSRLAAAERGRREEREGRAFRAATAVIATSDTAARDLAQRHHLNMVHVARPGVRPGPTTKGSVPLRIVAVGALTPTKDHLTLVRALAELTEWEWTARIVGSQDVDPEHTRTVTEAIDSARLTQRIALTGALAGPALESQWQAADLLVLPSRHETYGMVVLEALARGLPAMVTATGAAEALAVGGADLPRPGAVLPVGDHHAWAQQLREWLSSEELRGDWRRRAREIRPALPSWKQTAEHVRSVLAAT